MPDTQPIEEKYKTYKEQPKEIQDFQDFQAREHTRERIESLHKLLVGNGEPEKGFVFKVLEHQTKIDKLEKSNSSLWVYIRLIFIGMFTSLAGILWKK